MRSLEAADANARTLRFASRACETELLALRSNAASADGRAFNFSNMASVEDELGAAAGSDAARAESEARARRSRESAAEATADAEALRARVEDKERECAAAADALAAATAELDRLAANP